MLESPPEALKLIAATCSEPAAERSNGTKLFATSVARWPAGTVTTTPLAGVEAGAATVGGSLKTLHWGWAAVRAAIASAAAVTAARGKLARVIVGAARV